MKENMYKTKTVEDTEMVYSILREKYRDRQIEIEFNDNTKEYSLIVTDKKFQEDPEVPVDLKIKVIYGDSVTGDTPLLLQKDGQVYIETIQSIFDESKKVEYPGFKMFDKTIRLEKEYSLTDYKIWTDQGWVDINRVIRHKTDKKIYRVLTHNSSIDVSEDHSLLDDSYTKLKPIDLEIGKSLLSSFPTEFSEITSNYDNIPLNLYNRLPNVPHGILNAPRNIRLDYFKKYVNQTSLYTSDKIVAQRMYYLMQSINFNTVIYEENGIYYFSPFFSENKNLNQVKKIHELTTITTDTYIYDIETQIGRFACGIGNIIASNTDSVFLSMKFNRENFELNRKDAFKMGIICGDNLTDKIFKRPPIELEFEKVYQPFILLTKKRYIGKKFEDTRDPMKLKTVTTAGIALTRRNYSQVVKKCYKEVIDCILDTGDLKKSCDIYKKYIESIENYDVSYDDLVVSAQIGKEYACKECKKKTEWILRCKNVVKSKLCNESNPHKKSHCEKCKQKFECVHSFSLAHINLAQKLLERNEDIQIGDRIQYIFIEGNSKEQKNELAEDYNFAIKHNLKFNRVAYLEQVAKPVLGFLKVCLDQTPELLDDIIEYTNQKMVQFGGKKLRVSDFKINEDE
jgi:hypothetical protein